MHLSSLISSKKNSINVATLSETYTIDILSLFKLIALPCRFDLFNTETNPLLSPLDIMVRNTHTIDNLTIGSKFNLLHHGELALEFPHDFADCDLLAK